MVSVEQFFTSLRANGCTHYFGVPDSTLKELALYIADHSLTMEHVIGVNEGSAIGMAVGYNLTTREVPVVYMQNSGLGNGVNPLTSLAAGAVYAVPMLLLIGWRGAPGEKDEPQHVLMGEITTALLRDMNIPYQLIDKNSSDFSEIISNAVNKTKALSTPVAILIKKGCFTKYQAAALARSQNDDMAYKMTREEAIKVITARQTARSVIVATTGMASRELFEIRAAAKQDHAQDFLTVGGMGHASAIALAIARFQPQRRVVCLDGDGACLMHMGVMANIGQDNLSNFLHIVLNNGVHDSVGGQPTLAREIDLPMIAKACGYNAVFRVADAKALQAALSYTQTGVSFIEVMIKTGHRANLGRPTISPVKNKEKFMSNLAEIEN